MSIPPDNLPAIIDPTVAASASLTRVPISGLPDHEQGRGRLFHYASMIRRQAWKIGAFVAASLVVTFVISSRLEPVYESTAIVSFDRASAPIPASGQAAGADLDRKDTDQADQYVATQLKIIVSDPVLRPVSVTYNLLERENQLRGLTAEEASLVKESPIVLRRLRVSRPSRTYLIQISYRSTSPQFAADVANAIAQSYIEDIGRLQTSAALSASGFVMNKLEELKARMDRSTETATGVKAERSAANLEGKARISQRIQQLSTERANAEADRLEKEAAYNAVKSGSSETAPSPGQAEGLQRLQERINEAEERSAETKAAKGANDPDYKREQVQLQELQQQYQALSAGIAGRAKADFTTALAHERLVEKQLAQAKAELDRLNPSAVELQLPPEAEANKKLYEQMAAKSQEAMLKAGAQNRGTVVSDPARPSIKPVFPNLALNLGVAGILSCFLAIGMVVLLGSFDKSIRYPEEVRRLFGAELIGTLPLVKGTRSLESLPWSRGRESPLALSGRGDGDQTVRSMSAFEEAIRRLRNSVLLSNVERCPRSILVTSAAPGEGKSTAAMHLAMAHAEQGKKTLLIDADLRRPTLDKKLGVSDAGLGLSGAFLGETDWLEAVVQIPELPSLYLLPTGSPSGQASHLIGGSIAEMLDEAVRVYDLVILDAPPILGFAEPMHLAIAVDGVVIIASGNGADRDAIRAAVATLKRLRANLIGIVLNRLSDGAGGGPRYY